ncbi:MAG: lipoate--protein ligase family protein [Chloroflexota bacterium]
MGAVRLLDLGLVPSVRSQTIYHALAHAMAPDTPDTLVLVSPIDPYVCIGFHQDLEKEVDLANCRAQRLPVYRREVGGGAVYLDRGQIFTQWVFHRGHLPASAERRFELHSRPLVETYRELGIPAYHRPLNDIHVAGRKIGGTGAASAGEAEVVVGSLMLDFNTEAMARVLKVPSEKMRDKVYQSLREYMTTMTRELGQTPDRERVKAVYLDKCRAVLGAEIIPGTVTEQEEVGAREWDDLLLSPEWLYQRGGPRRQEVKIHEDVRVVEAAYKAPGGLIRVTARLREGRIDDLTLSGDFTLLPASAVGALEQSVLGLGAGHDSVPGRLQDVYTRMGLQSPGVTPEDFATAIIAATSQPRAGNEPTT